MPTLKIKIRHDIQKTYRIEREELLSILGFPPSAEIRNPLNSDWIEGLLFIVSETSSAENEVEDVCLPISESPTNIFTG